MLILFSIFLVMSFQNCGAIKLAALQSSINTLVLEVKVCTDSGFRLASIHTMNRNAFWKDGQLQMDFDADGLPDVQEGSDQASQKETFDSNGDGYRDLVNTNSSDLLPFCSEDEDVDNDDLVDCEENILTTDPEMPDTDGDGLIDLWELQFGLNPTNELDAIQDPDNDGLPTVTEVLQGSSPYETQDVNPRQRIRFTDAEQESCEWVRVEPLPLNLEKDKNQIYFGILEMNASGIQRLRKLNLLVSTQAENGSVIRHELAGGGL